MRFAKLVLAVAIPQQPMAVRSLALAPDGRTLVTGSETRAAHVRYVAFGNMERSGVWDVAEDIRLWDLASGKPLPPMTNERTIASHLMIAVSPDGHWLASGATDGTVWLWDRMTGKARGTFFVGRKSELLGVGGKAIAVFLPPFVKLELSGRIQALAFSADGKTLAAASRDGVVKLLDPASQREIATLPRDHTVRTVAFAPDGRTLVSGAEDAQIKWWDPDSGQETAAPVSHADTVAALAVTPDGKALASGSWDGKVKLWHMATRQELLTLEAHTGKVHCLGFSADGTLLVSGGETPQGSGEVFLWPASGAQSSWAIAQGE